jgi:hypothetical protein
MSLSSPLHLAMPKSDYVSEVIHLQNTPPPGFHINFEAMCSVERVRATATRVTVSSGGFFMHEMLLGDWAMVLIFHSTDKVLARRLQDLLEALVIRRE